MATAALGKGCIRRCDEDDARKCCGAGNPKVVTERGSADDGTRRLDMSC